MDNKKGIPALECAKEQAIRDTYVPDSIKHIVLPLKEQVINYFNNREDFYCHGSTMTHFFATWPKGSDKFIIECKKEYSGKNSISAEVKIYQETELGVEIKIEFYLWGHGTWTTVFEGWVENLDELKVVIKAVGL